MLPPRLKSSRFVPVAFAFILLLIALTRGSYATAVQTHTTTTMVEIQPTLDTWVNMTPGAMVPDPSSQLLFVGADEFTYEQFALLKYDIGVIPAEATILEAELDLWHEANASGSLSPHSLCVHRVASSWGSDVTSNSAPQIDSHCYSQESVAAEEGVHTWFALKSLAEEWHSGSQQNYGIAIRQAEYNFGDKAFQTLESNFKPVLKVRYALLQDESIDPQVEALDRLVSDSQTEPYVYFQDGIPRQIALAIEIPDGVASGENVKLYQALWFLNEYSKLFLMETFNENIMLNRYTKTYDNSGRQRDHLYFTQVIDNIPVFGSTIQVHIREGMIVGAGGNFLPHIPLSIQPELTAYDAEQIALNIVGTDVAIDGETRLYYVNRQLIEGTDDNNTRLAYRVIARGDQQKRIFIDAINGSIVLEMDELQEGDRPGEYFSIRDAGNSDSNTCFWLAWEGTQLWFNEDGPTGDYPGPSGDMGLDGQELFNNTHANYHYFYDEFSRRGWDAAGGGIEAIAHMSGPNASYVPACNHMKFRLGWVTPDVVTHEYVHGLIAHTSNLIYAFQPGAINESFADVFGIFFDGNWLVGEGIDPNNDGVVDGPIRSLRNPPSFGQPDHISNYFVTDINTDYGGVHTNSGIPNKVAYLLGEGDIHNGFNIDDLGLEKLQDLYYFLMVAGLGSNAQFVDLRNASVAFAHDFASSGSYGFTNYDVCQIINAWASVGIGSGDSDCDGLPNEFERNPDGDFIPDENDNCPAVSNPRQEDTDGDGNGDACDIDLDGDGVNNTVDVCQYIFDPAQADTDDDGVGDLCEDEDRDGVLDVVDNCPESNPGQEDRDLDGKGDICDSDIDGDGIENDDDNCLLNYNPSQLNSDDDELGDVCDNCDFVDNLDQSNVDGDSMGDACDGDIDGDGINNEDDSCPHDFDPFPIDFDGDGISLACDIDDASSLAPPGGLAEANLIFDDLTSIVRIPIFPCLFDGCDDWNISPEELAVTLATDAVVEARIVNDEGMTIASNQIGSNTKFQFTPGVDFYPIPPPWSSQPFHSTLSQSLQTDTRPQGSKYYLELYPSGQVEVGKPMAFELDIDSSEKYVYLPLIIR